MGPAEAPPPAAKLRICLVAHLAFGSLSGGRGHIGGVEYQTSLLARWLARRGHRVALVTWDEGQADGALIDGVTSFKACRADAGLRGLRFFHPRWTSLVAALRRADADVYYQNCGESVTGQVALEAKRRRKKFVYSVASDPDCDARLPTLRLQERLLYRYGLKAADRIIVQTHRQQHMLQTGFGRSALVLPMPCVGPPRSASVARALPASSPSRVLWVGRIAEVKRPDRLLDAARACPDLSFDLVGPSDGGAYARSIVDRARGLRNVTYHGALARESLDTLYRQSHVLLCTSEYEGFPNVFLEAWAHGVPIVSTVDPDDLLSARRLGAASDAARLVPTLRGLIASPGEWARASVRAREYYLEHHAVETAMPRFEEAFLDVVRGN